MYSSLFVASSSRELSRVIRRDGVTDSIRYDYHARFPTLLKVEDHYSAPGTGRFTWYTYGCESLQGAPPDSLMLRYHMLSQLGRIERGRIDTIPQGLLSEIDDPIYRTHLSYNEVAWNSFGSGNIQPQYEVEGMGFERDTVLTYDRYDDYGNLLSTIDGNGNKVYYYYGDNMNPFDNTADGLFHSKLTGWIKRKDDRPPDTTDPFGDSYQLANKAEYWEQASGWSYPGKPGKIYDNNENAHQFGYDGFGRLRVVLDSSPAVIEEYRYHYSRDDSPGFQPDDPKAACGRNQRA